MTRIKTKNKPKIKAPDPPAQKVSLLETSVSLSETPISLSAGIVPSGPSEYAKMISLSEQALKGKKKYTPGRSYKGTAEFLSNDNAEYLYLTNSYVARGIDTESEAIVRNGWTVKPNTPGDQQYIDLILKSTNFTSLIKEINTYIDLYGDPMVEMFPDEELKTTRFEILPPTEMDYLRDTSNKVIYDKKTGEPAGFVQKRDGTDINIWKGEDAKRIIVFKYRTLGGYVEGIPGIQTLLYPASEYGHIRSSIADSFIRSLPVCHVTVKDGSQDELTSASVALGTKFTARTSYVTSDRFIFNNEGPSNDIDVFKFIEPTLSEIAACFHMPIEMLGATQYLKGDDFFDRYSEWVEHIKMKQKIIASIFEQKVFNVLFPDGVTIKFNSPATVNPSELIKNVAFAMQSGAIDQELAFEIMARNQVFGAFSDEMIGTIQNGVSTRKVNDSGVQKEKEKVKVDDNGKNVNNA